MTVQDGLQAMKLQDLKTKTPTDLLAFAEELEIENASSMRKQDMLFAILKELAERNVEITGTGRGRDAAGRLRLPALAGIQLPAGPRRYLRFALADPPLRSSHRRHGRRPDPRAQGRRALFRAAEGHHDQFRGPGADQAQGPFRQSDAALSRPAGSRWSWTIPRSRTRPAASSTSSRRRAWASAPDHRPAAHRQDGHPAEHRQGDRGQSSRMSI